MSDARLRELEQRARAGEPGAWHAFNTACERAGALTVLRLDQRADWIVRVENSPPSRRTVVLAYSRAAAEELAGIVAAEEAAGRRGALSSPELHVVLPVGTNAGGWAPGTARELWVGGARGFHLWRVTVSGMRYATPGEVAERFTRRIRWGSAAAELDPSERYTALPDQVVTSIDPA